MPERHQVGEWLLEPNLDLGWASPTQVITILSDEGVELMLQKMVAIAPRARFFPEEFRSPSPSVMRARLRTLEPSTQGLGRREGEWRHTKIESAAA